MDQRRLLTIELWAKRTRALVGDSSRMYQVTVSNLVWPGVEGKPVPTSSEESRLIPRYAVGYPGGPNVQAQFWSHGSPKTQKALAFAIVEGARSDPERKGLFWPITTCRFKGFP